MKLCCLAVCLVGACTPQLGDVGPGPGGEDLPADLDVIASQPARGTIAGMSFSLGTRYMNISDGDLWVDLLIDQVTDCTKDQTMGSYPKIIFFLKPTPGRYPLDFSKQTVTLVDKSSSNLVVSRGVIQIDSIDTTTKQVTGGLHVFDGDYGEINGRFDGPLCYVR